MKTPTNETATKSPYVIGRIVTTPLVAAVLIFQIGFLILLCGGAPFTVAKPKTEQ